MAGTGKTTITYSLCAELDSDRKLAASFFCSRLIPECRDVNLIIPSIAHQLARASKPFHYALSRALETDPDAHAKLLRIQFDTLITSPLAEVGDALPENMVVAIDALDECTDKESTSQILDILLTRASHLPLKFLVSSRPEPRIRDKLEQIGTWICPSLALHNLDRNTVQSDIQTYLRMSLASMDLPESQIAILTERSGILFIYAATVVRFVGYDNFRRNPRARLEIILSASASSQGLQFNELDQLYATILKEALNDPSLTTTEQRDIREVLYTIICARESLTLSGLCGLLKFEDLERIRAALRPLWSVLHIVNASEVVTTLHMSFPDYLLDPSRSGEYSCDVVSQNRHIALLCFERIKDMDPQFNICNLGSSFIVDQEVVNLEERVRNTISTELFYACQHWAAHLQVTDSSCNLVGELGDFFSKRLLLWIEIMNLKGAIHSSGKILELAEGWSTHTKCPQELIELIHDSWRFASVFALNNVSASTPHLYVSMLSLWPPENPISKCYSIRTRGTIKAHDEATFGSQFALIAKWKVKEEACSASFSSDGSRIVVGAGNRVYIMNAFDGSVLLALSKRNNSQVNSAVFSSDGKLVAACSADRHVYVWEIQTGEVIFKTYRGTPGFTTSITFSPVNSNIVLGSKDGVVRIWDPLAGQILVELPGGPSDPIMAVAICSDGSLIAAGYRVMNICVWNARTNQMVANLAGRGVITSISFSFDSTRIVSGTFKGLIFVWDVQTRRVVLGPLKGHTDHITSVSFSPDDKRIVSSAADKSIRFWDSQNGSILILLEGHTNPVTSVAFSPDGTQVVSTISSPSISIWDARGQYTHSRRSAGHVDFVIFVGFCPDGNIISGSSDGAIIKWDPRTGTQISYLNGSHIEDISSLALSPNSHVIASGSYDGTIHVRGTSDGQLLLNPLEGHSGYVMSVQFSPDGARIVSGSTDMTICVWSTQDGRMLLGPLNGHTHSVISLGVSSDGNHIVSGSSDETVIIWNSHDGQMILGPLLGHTDGVTSVKFSPDGTRIVSGSHDCTVCVWDTRSGHLVYNPLEGHTDSVESVDFSHDGAWIVSGSLDKTICVWNAQNGQLALGPLKGHTNWVSCVAFSPDGTKLVSGSDDKTVRMHDIQVLNSAASPLFANYSNVL
ncbi:putative WD repeat-containing protein alr3466 OS=Nostoc sp, (strain PCC 7120 / UTEX 2576) GN=alr3466 PE=4 SV=1 [Rhizoctonia solani AG-1 IB]|uniref:Putative WD repeat-containing protein alr3466 n=1 Tax=Thanatephorus cucumeris (strain AG1-IB / isolate 7/3/14) TaxID=1108050 RepID=A0A0B7FXU2_THACB|nr:putative WD repeat-containing protein alr3466 OS=Nostoc sp, (strain PCC 7120 / UTEX 2576) GN=alr3466 PE=4 SV=1 [Rhizoctonia solani AG-1 IB]